MFIFFQNIILTDDSSTFPTYFPDFSLQKSGLKEIKALLGNPENIPEQSKVIFSVPAISPESLKIIFSSSPLLIEAAGGLITNDKNELLMIFRKGKWDLPKGKTDKKESPEQAAIRECMEECGIQQLTLKKFLEHTHHLYKENEQWILKKTHWFSFFSKDKNVHPQYEEDITDIAWTPANKINTRLKNTFPLIQYLIKKYFIRP